MEQKALIKAAREGNTSKLQELLKINPLVLEKVMPPFSETPLHVAALVGHAEFAKLLLHHAPIFAEQTNRQGLNPLHVAAAKGHANVVSVLLEYDQKLAVMGDFNGETPLHYAAYYGRVCVAKLLACNKPQLLELVNSKGETARHVAVKNKQLEVIPVLGNEFSDQVLAHEEDEFEHSIEQLVVTSDFQATEVRSQSCTPKFSQSRYGEASDNDKINSEVQTMLVIGTLIATVTFQALINPPQSLWNNGAAIEKKIKLYIFFLACNSVGFFASCAVIIFVALRKDTSMLHFWVSSALTWAALGYLGVLISMIDKVVFPKIIIASLVMVVPNVIVSLCRYSRKAKKVVRKIKTYANI